MEETHSNWSHLLHIICCRLYTVVSDRVCSSTDRIRKLCYIRSYSIEIKSVKQLYAIVSGTYVYGSFGFHFKLRNE